MKRIIKTTAIGLLIGTIFCFSGCIDDTSPNIDVESSITSTVHLSDEPDSNAYIVNTNTMVIHIPSCSSVANMPDENKAYYTGSCADLTGDGYILCSRCHPEEWDQKQQKQEGNNYDTDRIICADHPTLFDAVATAKNFWTNDLSDDAVVIRDSEHFDQDYSNAYLILDCFKTEDGAVVDSEQITAIHIPNYNCKDVPRFNMTDAIELTRSYLPVSVLTEKYVLRDSAYENLWADDYVWDGATRKPQIQYDYYTNYELKEESTDVPAWISVHVFTDRFGIVVDANILPEQYHPTGEIADWGYDYIENNSTYETGIIGNELYVDKELGIDYPRPSGTPALSRGSKGGKVGWLQCALNKAMYANLDNSCVFDDETDSAVREFQTRCRLGADGTAGPKTIAELVEIVSGRKPMPEKVVETEPPRIRIAPEPDPPADTPSYTPSVSNNTGSGSYLLNTKTGVYHNSESCPAARRMSEENKLWISWSEAQAYTPCGKCVS